jgi:DNA-binding transcriptional ArsR family regulator
MYYSQHIENIGYFRAGTAKLLGKSENLFLNRLIFWSKHPKRYGVLEEGRAWIYNTLDEWAKQLKISKSSVRRAVSSLRGQGIVDARYLSANRRDRTLFYAVNYEKLRFFLGSKKRLVYVQKSEANEHTDEHMVEHMYIETINNKQINKSNKSRPAAVDILKEKDSEREKPSIVQDMVGIWKEEISSEVTLTRKLCGHLVKIFKDRFNSSLREWKRYLQLIKTSAWLTGEKFKLTLYWAIKFVTVDRLRTGELGVKKDEIPVDENEALERAQQHIDSLNETEKCKEIRRKIVKIYGVAVYNSWFTGVMLREINGKIAIKYPDEFVGYQVRSRYPDILEGLKDFENQLNPEEKIEFGIEFLNETEKCKETRKKIAKKFGADTYDSLFEVIQLQEKDGKLMIKRSGRFNSFKRTERRYADILIDYEIMTEPENQFKPDEETVRQHINAVNETEKCKEIRRKIAEKFGVDTYNFLFMEIKFQEEGEKLTIRYPDFISRRRIQKKYADIFACYGITETEEEKRRFMTFEEEAQQHIESLSESEKCKKVRKKIVKKWGEKAYVEFFKEIQLQEEDGKLTAIYPKLFRKEWMPKKYADILNGITGEFEEGIKPEKVVVSSEKETRLTISLEEEIQRHIEFLNETETSKEVRKKIVKKLGVRAYNTYFRRIQLRERNGKLAATYPDSVVKWWIQKKYADVLIDYGIESESGLEFNKEKKGYKTLM